MPNLLQPTSLRPYRRVPVLSDPSVQPGETVLAKCANRPGGREAPCRKIYAEALYKDDGASLDDLREAVTTLEDTTRIMRRVLGGSHPLTKSIENDLQNARAALHSSEAL